MHAPAHPDPARSISLPALLRMARGAYSVAIRAALDKAGHGAIPGNGLFLLGVVARAGAGGLPHGEVVQALGASRQAAGQLVETMVARGYLARRADDGDRRRFKVALTERGRQAAGTMGAVIAGIEDGLLDRVGAEVVANTRTALQALCGIEAPAGGGGHAAAATTFRSLAPVLTVPDLQRALAYYRDTLGFAIEFEYGGHYASVLRDGCRIHFRRGTPGGARQLSPDHVDVCVMVADAAVLAARCDAAGAEFAAPLRDMPYGREFYLRDPDGYVLAFVQGA